MLQVENHPGKNPGDRLTESTDVGKNLWVEKKLAPRTPTGYLGFTILLSCELIKMRNCLPKLLYPLGGKPGSALAGASVRFEPLTDASLIHSVQPGSWKHHPTPTSATGPGICKMCYPDPYILSQVPKTQEPDQTKTPERRKWGIGHYSEVPNW